MLGGGNALTVGVGIVIEVIRKNNSDYDPDVGAEASSLPSSRDPIYLGTLLRLFAEHVPEFGSLIMNAPAQRARLDSTFGDKIEPLGFDRFKTCELMAELLHCSNMGLLNEVGSEELIAARDAERQRLRVEGKLSAMRGEELPSSADDLTMRISHSSPVDEGRRLEITNISEDDGFEEVAHSTEMTEDTSHEFVKAEEEIPSGHPASLLEKDEDDFVDEPLTSPRLKASSEQTAEVQFEEPDLVVAPLSPSKHKAAEIDELPPSPSKAEKLEDLVDDMQKSMLEDKPEEIETADTSMSTAAETDSLSTPMETPPASSIADSDAGPNDSEVSQVAATESTPEAEPAQSDESKAEDAEKPAPLFSKPADTTQGDPSDQADSQASKSQDVDSTAAAATDESAQQQQGTGDASIVVGHEGQPQTEDLSSVQPVVGDFLKMQFVEHGVVSTILSFFFKYPWNNFLHNVVYDIVQQVFNGPMDRGFNPTLAISLFEAADITSQIINGQRASEESQRQSKTRMGYMGHLTLIAEEVVKFTERHPPELLSETVLQKVMDQEWINYVEGALAETRERDNAILGGVRPEVALSNRQAGGLAAVGLSSLGAAFGSSQGSSSGLAEAGLNGGLNDMGEGGTGNGIGPFAISAGTLMSGFGSSSDEDEDEEAENEEDVNNEVSYSFDRRPRRHSGLSFAGRPAPHLFIRSAIMRDSGGSDEDSDEEDCGDGGISSTRSERHITTATSNWGPTVVGSCYGSEDQTLQPLQVQQTGSDSSVCPPNHFGPSEDQMFEDVSLDDAASDSSMDHMSPDEWEDVDEDMDTEADPVIQVEDRVQAQNVVGQVEGDTSTPMSTAHMSGSDFRMNIRWSYEASPQ